MHFEVVVEQIMEEVMGGKVILKKLFALQQICSLIDRMLTSI